MTTIGDIVSKVRGNLKEVTDDSSFSNRTIWSIFSSISKYLIKNDADSGRLFKMTEGWQPICIEMEPVSSIYCNCIYLPYDCTVFRSKKKLPSFLESSNGPIYRWISTPDLSRSIVLVTPFEYEQKSKIKFSRSKFAFVHDNYLYTPKEEYPLLSLSAFLDFTEDFDISDYQCDSTESVESCNTMLSRKVQIPFYLEDAAIKMTLDRLLPVSQKVQDEVPNANSNQKETN